MVKVPKGYRSRNVQDRRGSRSSGGLSSGGLGGLGGALGGGSLGGSRGAASPAAGRRGCGGLGLVLVVVFGLLLFLSLIHI